MIYLFPLTEYKEHLWVSANHYTKLYQLNGLTHSDCHSLIVSLIEEGMYNQLCWSPKVEKVIPFITHHFLNHREEQLQIFYYQLLKHQKPNNDIKPIDLLVDDFYYRVIDPIEIIIAESLNQFIENNRWIIWHIEEFEQDLLLKKGEDYRLVYFESKLDSGELKFPNKTLERIRKSPFDTLVL